MRVRITRQCDSPGGRALFPGQFYDLPEDEAAFLVKVRDAELVEPEEVLKEEREDPRPRRTQRRRTEEE